MWTEAALHRLLASELSGQQIIVLAKREPYVYRFAGDSIECTRPASGMAAAREPVVRFRKQLGRTWLGRRRPVNR
jgi:trehalose 6-phosphate synthase